MEPRSGPLKIVRRLSIVELVATAILGGIGALVDTRLGVFIWAAGILLAINQLRSEAKLEQGFAPLSKLAEVIDLDARCGIEPLQRLFDAYIRIPEPEFQRAKDTVLAAAHDELSRLATQKSSGELTSGAYYQWLINAIDHASSGATIIALSLMLPSEWDESQAERHFIDANKRAAERGVKVIRVFVARRKQLLDAWHNPAVRLHMQEEAPANLQGYFVDQDWLQLHDAPLATRLGEGFIADDRIALIDNHAITGAIRGVATMLPTRHLMLKETHKELMMHARPLGLDLLTPSERAELACANTTHHVPVASARG